MSQSDVTSVAGLDVPEQMRLDFLSDVVTPQIVDCRSIVIFDTGGKQGRGFGSEVSVSDGMGLMGFAVLHHHPVLLCMDCYATI